MTETNLKKGIELNDKIKRRENDLKLWNSIKSISSKTLEVLSNSNVPYNINTSHIEIEALKYLVTCSIEKELKQLKEEFEKL